MSRSTSTTSPAAKTFYGTAFGWQFTDYGDCYAGIQAPDGDGEVGGLTRRRRPRGQPAGPALSPRTSTAASALSTDGGGEVVEGPYDYPGGRRFLFRDPSGNVLGVFQPSDS